MHGSIFCVPKLTCSKQFGRALVKTLSSIIYSYFLYKDIYSLGFKIGCSFMRTFTESYVVNLVSKCNFIINLNIILRLS